MSKGEKKEIIHISKKHCPHCNRNLPATSEYFHRNKYRKDGLTISCKECRNELTRKNRKLHKYPHGSEKGRILNIKHTVFEYFLKKYCEFGPYIFRNEFFYEHFLSFAEKFHISPSKCAMTKFFQSTDNISLLYDPKSGRRLNQKKIKGIRFNEKGIKKFGISNLCNLEIDPKKIHTYLEACKKISCEYGRSNLRELYESLSPEMKSKINYNATLKCYKKIESYLFKLNKVRDTSVKIATALYLSNKNMTQRISATLSGCHEAALRTLYKLLKIEKEEYLEKEKESEN